MRSFQFVVASMLIAFITSFCTYRERVAVDILVLNASVVDVENEQIHTNRYISIKGDSIFSVGSMKEKANYDPKEVLDVQGKYIMPGLWDNHVHFRGGTDLIVENQNLLGLFIRYGVTTVRDAGGDITPSVLEWQQKINNHELLGPGIFTSGPKLDGPEPAWAGSIKVDTKEQIRKALDSLQALKVDYVKVYDGSLSEESFYAIIDETNNRGLKVTGHMPMSADFEKAVDLGLDGSEHMYYIMKACSPKADSLTELGLGYAMMETITDTYDEDWAVALFKKLAQKEVYITPTLYIGKVLSALADEDHSGDTLLSEIGIGIQASYVGRVKSAKRAKEGGSQMREKVSSLAKKMMSPMYEMGVPLLAGSDCGPYNSFVYPGEALWGELFSLTDAGLSPAEALKTSVTNGPAFMGLQNKYGSVSQGKVADLLILKANPLEDIQHIRSLERVILKGNLIDSSL